MNAKGNLLHPPWSCYDAAGAHLKRATDPMKRPVKGEKPFGGRSLERRVLREEVRDHLMRDILEGRLTPDKNTGGPRIWNKQDGSMGASFEVTAGTVRFLSSRGELSGEGPMMGGMEGAEIPAEDDIPF